MTEDLSAAPGLYQRMAQALVEERGWDRAALLATAVRGYVYDSPQPSPYRDEAEAIYKRLGWEQSALLASWFRDFRNRPGPRAATPTPVKGSRSAHDSV